MRPERMLSGCACAEKKQTKLKSLGFLGKGAVPQKYLKADGVLSNTLKVSELNTISNETPNLFDGFQQLIVNLGIDTDNVKQLEMFKMSNTEIIGSKGFTVDEIFYAIGRFLSLVGSAEILDKTKIASLSPHNFTEQDLKITFGEYLNKISKFVESEKGKSPLLTRMLEKSKKRDAFTKELQDYLGWDQKTQQYTKSINPRDFFEYFLVKYDLDNPKLGEELVSRVDEITIDGKIYDPQFLDILIHMATSYGASIRKLSSVDVKGLHLKTSALKTNLTNSTRIDMVRDMLGMKSSTKILLGVGGASVVGLLGYFLFVKKN